MRAKLEVNASRALGGIRHNNRQYQCKLQVSVACPEEFFNEEAEKLLKFGFCIALPSSILFMARAKNTMNLAMIELITTGSAIAQNLLEFGSFPSYDSVVVVGAAVETESPCRTVVDLLIPTEQYQNHELISKAYLIGLETAWAFTQKKSRSIDVLNKANATLENFVKSLRYVTNGGQSTQYILKEAFNRGLPIACRPGGQYQVGMGKRQRVFLRSATLQDSFVGAQVTKDKLRCIHHLKTAGIPTPVSYRVTDADEAKKLAQQHLGFPVVLKPANLDRGEGVFVNLKTDQEIDHAFSEIQKLSNNVLIENHVSGICHRLLVFRGEVIFAFARHPLSVVGDGESDIASLISANAKEQSYTVAYQRKPIPLLDSEALSALKMQGLGPNTVLERNQIASLRPFQSSISGGYDEILTDSVHPDNAALACRAASLFGLEIAGIDLISSDITRAWYDNDAVINEVNFQPQIRNNSATAILDRYFPDNIGEIPIYAFVGNSEALEAALKKQALLCDQSVDAFLTSHAVTIGPDQSEIRLFGMESLFRRIESLLRNPQVGALVVVIQTNEPAFAGLPFYRLSELKIVNQALLSFRNLNKRSANEKVDETITLLNTALNRKALKSVVTE